MTYSMLPEIPEDPEVIEGASRHVEEDDDHADEIVAPAPPPGPRPPQVARAPLQRSLQDDVPHGLQSSSEEMRRRVYNGERTTGRPSDFMSEPAPGPVSPLFAAMQRAVSYTHLRAHETGAYL
eukprot:8711761-Pyramimonas_sp.AAC.1